MDWLIFFISLTDFLIGLQALLRILEDLVIIFLVKFTKLNLNCCSILHGITNGFDFIYCQILKYFSFSSGFFYFLILARFGLALTSQTVDTLTILINTLLIMTFLITLINVALLITHFTYN
jgi:hypothetical protein